ncbi:EAL domain-containing protein (plasmid) [Aneurinibacillus sp. Ricciae_BoGa-3]|uniref:EAL domain-containing protein n=1 Tax=Aneurinibacillus sp. Ricciae_BoGa-3 TaxID=3022697 RepID=UPI0023425853|nr:EAL domain-containing protein [Aneurinibacillus sp. Ricciae_BoGa-3]WCK57150.1 EAL domain-containing protein [Aneurinibacillus sp. Ricciae_BoGa-3]
MKIWEHSDDGLPLDTQLMQALQLEEFRLHYQPKIDLISGKIIGVEALIRWEHPEKGRISPLDFIPIAEETGLILPIGEWVMRTACEQNKIWQKVGVPPMIMGVNLSARQLYQSDLVDRIEQILKETELGAEYLELEITESMIMDIDHVLPILKELKRIGIRISLDDFGTGYSSLFYLKELPIDILKVDQSFVRNCTIDTKDATLVKGIIAMAHELRIEVIAEGVESKEHLVFLQQNLCDKGQGYLFSKPLPSDKLIQKMNEIEQIIKNEGIPPEVYHQKWMEEALKTARQELRDTVRQQQGMIFKFVKEGNRFVHVLCDGELLYRMKLTPEEIIGREPKDFLPENEAELKVKHYERAWAGEDKVSYKGNINGIWYIASLRPIRSGGQVTEVIGSCVDITELKESEERYRRLVNLSPEPIVVHSQGIIKYMNQAGVKVLGFHQPKELLGKSFLDFFHPCSLKKAIQRIQRSEQEKEGQVELIEYQMIRHDGTIFHAEGTAVGIRYEGEPAIQGMFRDVTARKQAEQALHKSEEKYRLIAENTQDLIRVLDTKGFVRYASPSHEKVLGYPPEIYEGKLAFDFVHPEDVHPIQTQFISMVSSKASFRVEFRYKHAKGGWVCVESSGTPVLDEQGEVEHLVVVCRDISERKKAEEMMQKSEKLSVVGQLASGVAHEIRNPLTSIQGFIQLMKEEVDKPMYFDIILSEIHRLEEIVEGFLALAKLQVAKMKEIDIKILLKEVIIVFGTQAILKNVEIVEEYDSDLQLVLCDANQIKQVFINILQNAVEAMPNGGMLKIQVLRYSSDSIQFRFIDSGEGISEERLKHIGEPFFSTKEKGTGLGLMVSQKIIEEHGGTLHITSTLNKGTTVEVRLPVQ